MLVHFDDDTSDPAPLALPDVFSLSGCDDKEGARLLTLTFNGFDSIESFSAVLSTLLATETFAPFVATHPNSESVWDAIATQIGVGAPALQCRSIALASRLIALRGLPATFSTSILLQHMLNIALNFCDKDFEKEDGDEEVSQQISACLHEILLQVSKSPIRVQGLIFAQKVVSFWNVLAKEDEDTKLSLMNGKT